MKIGLIGCGHMGSAIVKCIAGSSYESSEFLLSDTDSIRARNLREILAPLKKCDICDNEEIADSADLIILAVKPQGMRELLSDIRDILNKRKIENRSFCILTMAAGISLSAYDETLRNEFPIIRIMPNTPIDVGQSIIAYSAARVSESDLSVFAKLLSDAGILLPVSEDKMNAISSVSGSGPAFVYTFIEGMANAGEKLGLTREEALLLTAQTVKGSAEMILKNEGTPLHLRDLVCSPGGTTIEGVKVLEKENFRDILENAIEASYKRNLELQ